MLLKKQVYYFKILSTAEVTTCNIKIFNIEAVRKPYFMYFTTDKGYPFTENAYL